MYTDSQGRPKGDALVTFANADAVPAACIKFHGLDIGDGYVISVTKAAFEKSKYEAPRADETMTSVAHPSVTVTHTVEPVAPIPAVGNVQEEALCLVLPRDSAPEKFPVVHIRQAFDASRVSVLLALDAPEKAAQLVRDLETDMLLECCAYGNVTSVVVLTSEFVNSTLNAAVTHGDRISRSAVICDCLIGSIAVSFEVWEAARSCSAALHGKILDGRVLSAFVLETEAYIAYHEKQHANRIDSSMADNAAASMSASSVVADLMTSVQSAQSQVFNTAVAATSAQSTAYDSAADDVDDFLNSLL